MTKPRKYFYCHGGQCHYREHPVAEIAQQLDNKSLCQGCYDAGLRLKMGVVVVRIKSDKEVN